MASAASAFLLHHRGVIHHSVTRELRLLLALGCFAASVGRAAPAPASTEASAEQRDVASPQARAMYGLSATARLMGGYAIVDGTVVSTPTYPQLDGADEGLGLGTAGTVSLGYDVNARLALEAIGGVALISGRRAERVRDLAASFAGAGVRVSWPLAQGLALHVTPSVTWARCSNAVERAESSLGVHGAVGLEYYPRVRHFSLGLVAVVLAITKPQRVMVGVAPQLRYTF